MKNKKTLQSCIIPQTGACPAYKADFYGENEQFLTDAHPDIAKYFFRS